MGASGQTLPCDWHEALEEKREEESSLCPPFPTSTPPVGAEKDPVFVFFSQDASCCLKQRTITGSNHKEVVR